MKKIKLLLFVVCIGFGLLASGQVPQLIDYQAMARDGSGNPLANTTISARMSVFQGPLPGAMVYSELHNPMTNSYGLFELMIGGGSVLFGAFNTIPWSTGNYFIQTEIDPTGGVTFIDMGMSKMITVPFAFYAASAGGGGASLWQQNGSDIYYDAGNVAIGHDTPLDYLHIENTGGTANARITSDQSYYIADASGNTGLWFQENNVDVAWLYWNPPSQAMFMYENGTQTMTWKQNNVGIGITDPLVKLQVYSSSSAGVLGDDLGLLTNGTQALAISVLGITEDNSAEWSLGMFAQANSATSDYVAGVRGNGGEALNNTYGVYGYAEGNGFYNFGVFGYDQGAATNSYAGYFLGDVHVTGVLTKSGGTFKIDHPQDPANKYLVHSAVESPDMMNIYNGNVLTDASGLAVVELPSYFDALNIEFRYQLTAIGTFAQAIVKDEISGNHFTIQTDKPNVKVSWQVTGVRNDVWAQENRIPAEVDKNSTEKGRYMHPELYGQDANMGLTVVMPDLEDAAYKAPVVKEKDPLTEPVLK